MHHTPNAELDQCIRHCLDCYRECQSNAMQHCLEMGGRHVAPDHFRLMADCAEICRTAAALMLNGSPYHAATCAVCAEICRACAASCRSVGDMDDCAEACERCADSCERMAQMVRGGSRQTAGASPRAAQ